MVFAAAFPQNPMRASVASEPLKRREFLRSALRYTALTGIAGVAASAIARRAPLNGPACGGQGICGDCTHLAGCGETRAAAERESVERAGG